MEILQETAGKGLRRVMEISQVATVQETAVEGLRRVMVVSQAVSGEVGISQAATDEGTP